MKLKQLKILLSQSLRTMPKKYQGQAIQFLEKNNGRGILGDDMGLGKTLQAIGWLSLNPEAVPVVIVCPSNVKYQWQDQLEQHAEMKSEVLIGKTPYLPSLPIFILNYEILSAAYWPNGKKKRARPKFPWVDYLMKMMNPKCLIVDEFHYVKNKESLRTRAVIQMGRKIPHIIALSGTPVEKCPIEFFPMLNLIAPKGFPSLWEFAFQYCDPKKGFRGRGWDFSGSTNTEELHELVKPIMIRRLKTEVAQELPPKIRSVIPVEISNKKEYNQAETDFTQWVEKVYGQEYKDSILAKGGIAITKIGMLKRLTALGKLPNIKIWIQDFLDASDEKLVVCCVHKKITKELKIMFPKSVHIDGSVEAKNRPGIVKEFQTNPKCRIFIGQLKAAGIGLDGLQHAASNLLFVELGWNFSEHEQMEDRCLRIGQKASSVNIYYMIGKDTIEEKIIKLIQKKHDICNEILNGQFVPKNLFGGNNK